MNVQWTDVQSLLVHLFFLSELTHRELRVAAGFLHSLPLFAHRPLSCLALELQIFFPSRRAHFSFSELTHREIRVSAGLVACFLLSLSLFAHRPLSCPALELQTFCPSKRAHSPSQNSLIVKTGLRAQLVTVRTHTPTLHCFKTV